MFQYLVSAVGTIVLSVVTIAVCRLRVCRSGRAENASLLPVRRHGQHGLENGVQRRRYTKKCVRPMHFKWLVGTGCGSHDIVCVVEWVHGRCGCEDFVGWLNSDPDKFIAALWIWNRFWNLKTHLISVKIIFKKGNNVLRSYISYHSTILSLLIRYSFVLQCLCTYPLCVSFPGI